MGSHVGGLVVPLRHPNEAVARIVFQGWRNLTVTGDRRLFWRAKGGTLSDSQALRTILVVEDDPAMLEILRILLEDCGCRIIAANRGQEAIELAREAHPDVITLDLGLPDMDGQEVLRQLGDDLGWAARVIVVTARQFEARPGDNVVAVLEKPFDAAELERVVREALAISTNARPGGHA